MIGKRRMNKPTFETVINHNENDFQNTIDFFPIGLIILEKDSETNDYKIKEVNSYILKLLDLPRNLDIQIFKERLKEFKQWENNHLSELNLKQIIFEHEEHYHKFQSGTFISPLSMIYIKIKTVKKNIYICMDNYNDERKSIQVNLTKSLKYQYIVTLYHELNNPLNALQNIVEDNLNEENQMVHESYCDCKIKMNDICLLVNLIQVFIKNFIWYFKVIFECSKDLQVLCTLKINLEYEFSRVLNNFAKLFKYKEIRYSTNFTFLNDKYIETNEDYLTNFLRGVYILLYHMIPKKNGFELHYSIISDKKIKLNFKKFQILKSERKSKIINDIDFRFKQEFDFSKTVQTIEMTKELLMNLSEILKIKIKFYDEDEDLLLSLIIPYSTEKEDIEFISECTQEQKNKKFEAINRKILITLNDESKYLDNITSPNNHRGSSNLQSSNTQSFGNKKCNFDEFKNNNNNTINNFTISNNTINFHSRSNSKNNENIDITLLENDPFIKVTKDKNFKIMEITDSDISNSSFKESISPQSIKKKPKRKTFSNEESVNISANFRPTINGYLAAGKLSGNNVSLKRANNTLNEISISYKNRITEKTSPREKVTTRLSTYEKNYNYNKFCNCSDVLLCDDESFNLTTIKNMLKKFNVECDTSSNGQECIDAIINKKELNCSCDKKYYKLIFLDMMMPIMNGLEAAKRIQRMIDDNEISNNIKIIIVSAHIEENLIKELKNIKCIVETIQKPLKKSKVEELLNSYYYC